MPTLPITAILCTPKGIVLRYADGSTDAAKPVRELPHLSPIELQAVKYACENGGWIVIDTYLKNKEN